MAVSLDLLHPTGLISLRNWTFEDESVIRIGREPSNHIVLYSRVVSRFHAMLWGLGNEWKIVNLSCNGTYLDDKIITHALLEHGAVIRLAPSGPRLRFRVLTQTNDAKQNLGKQAPVLDLMQFTSVLGQNAAAPNLDREVVLPKAEERLSEMMPRNL